MKRNIFIQNILVGSVLLIVSCFPVKTTTGDKKTTTAAIYNPSIQQLHPEFYVFHPSNEKSRLYIKLNLSELMFSPIGQGKAYISKIKIEYKTFAVDNSNNFIDSASIVFDLKKRKGENSAITYLSLNENALSKYYLKVNTIDLLKQNKSEDFILIDKEDKGNEQNFMINLKSIIYPYFNNYFNNGQLFTIQYKEPVEKIYIRYFAIGQVLPPPPFSSMARSSLPTFADSSWTVDGKTSFDFNQKKPGLYYIQIDTTLKSGLGLVNSGANFPFIKTSESMLYPLEYLMNSADFRVLQRSDNKKLAIDKFWLNCGKNVNRSRELIRIYYSRVFYANVYFTSFTEGWRTDRGMIYIIFGPPKTVKKTKEKETWYYYGASNSSYLQFVFNKNQNQFTDNDYILERVIDFKQFWSQAINSWKQGKVYHLFEQQ